MSRRILVSWIGHTDLRAFGRLCPTADKELIAKSVPDKPGEVGSGPVKGLVDVERFDAIHLLGDFESDLLKPFGKWIGKSVTTHFIKLENPSDHGQILRAVRPRLDALQLQSQDELCFHLSPGTPAMAAIWILLGKSQYPATLYQTHADKVWKTEIPFDITIDVLPQLMREPDRYWQHLQAHGPQEVGGFEKIIGNSPVLRAAVGRAQRAAIHEVPILVLGETGCGKEMFADAIHRASSRHEKKMYPLNCAAISRDLIESELFGHVKGAFTGATSEHKGLLEQANGGTLFLDEVGECDLSLQAKLLRALQPPAGKGPCHRVFRPVGATEDRTSDVRIIAATNRDLMKQVEKGLFREDLYHRLATITIKLPPLRERGDDILLLADRLLAEINTEFKPHLKEAFQEKKLSVDAKKFIRHQPWRGNVRELKNALIQAAVMSASDTLNAEDLAAAVADVPGQSGPAAYDAPLGNGFSLDELMNSIERRFLKRAMEEADGSKTKAAELLGIKHYQTLSNRIEKLGVDLE